MDDYYQTNIPGYYAIGDCVPGQALAHVASAEGITCVEKIAGHHPEPINYGNIPGCTYCSPEVASVGMTEAQAKVGEILSHLEGDTLDGTEEPLRVYLTCYRVLRANQDPRARKVLETAHRLLQETAVKIGDAGMRRKFLNNVVIHREIAAAYNEQEAPSTQSI